MANRLFSPTNRKIGSVSRNLKAILGTEPARDYSNQGWRRKNLYVEQVLFGHLEKQAQTVWPDPNLGCLGPKDTRLSLPGNVGLESSLNPKSEKATPEQLQEDKKRMEDEISFWRNLCESPSNYQRQLLMLQQHEEVEKIQQDEIAAVERALQEKMSPMLECKAQPCPDLLRRELTGLFVSMNLSEGPLTVITFCQRTVNDMTAWSSEVEEERDELVENFIRVSKEICAELRRKSQWADFVEPNSGRPFYSPYTNATFFETDERYRHLGFRIQDLGCCKVISHHKWGTHAFVGSIFTTAPADSDYVQEIIRKTNMSEEESKC